MQRPENGALTLYAFVDAHAFVYAHAFAYVVNTDFITYMPDRPTTRSAVVLVCDRLNPAFLGPYGNTWIETAAMNRLAAESLLVEQCLTPSLDLRTVYDGYWSSLSNNEQSTTLVSDDESLMAHPIADGFDTHVVLPDSSEPTVAASEMEETSWATLMSAAIHQCEENRGEEDGRLLWVHGQGCQGNWNAPFAIREMYVGEDDPSAPDFVNRPSRCLDGEVDPDELLGLQQAYAAEITVFDHCLAPLVDALSSDAMRDTLFVLTSPRAFPLGEHAVIGDARPLLQFESLQVPLLVRFPDKRYQTERLHSLWQPSDVGELLRQWLSGEEVAVHEFGSERQVARADDQWSLRTPAWFATGSDNGSGDTSDDVAAKTRLYAKPDDRFEANDVAGICEQIATEMRAEFERVVEADRTGTVSDLPPLADELRVPQD